jgi:hypothetical protein
MATEKLINLNSVIEALEKNMSPDTETYAEEFGVTNERFNEIKERFKELMCIGMAQLMVHPNFFKSDYILECLKYLITQDDLNDVERFLMVGFFAHYERETVNHFKNFEGTFKDLIKKYGACN